MPFSGPNSYLETIDEFIGHWTDVDAALAPAALTLAGGYNLAALQAGRTLLSDGITELVVAINDVEGHRTDRDNRKDPLRERMRQLGGFIRGVLAGSSYVGRIPDLIPVQANAGKWLIAMRDNHNIWTDIEAAPPAGFVPPLLLTGAYTLANFTADIADLEATLNNLTLTEQVVEREVDERDAVYQSIRDQLVLYRQAVPGMFPAGHPLISSLPRITPLPGHTPDAVVLSGVWNQLTTLADLSWTASVEPDLLHYQVRRSGASPYSTSTELVVATVPTGTLVLSTLDGLPVDGATMGYKVYVVLTTGNEKGSNAVSITREDPLPPPPTP